MHIKNGVGRFIPALIPRRVLVVLHDLIIAGLSVGAAFYLRIGYFPFPSHITPTFQLATFLFLGLFIAAAMYFGMHQGMWRFTSVPDLVLIGKTVTVSVISLYLILFLIQRLEFVHRSVPFVHWGLLVLALGGSRLIYRWVVDKEQPLSLTRSASMDAQRQLPVLLIGADFGAANFIRAMRTKAIADYRVLGIVCQSAENKGRRILGIPVLGTISDLPSQVRRLAAAGQKPARLVMTEQIEVDETKQLLKIAQGAGVMLCRMPEPTQLRETSADDAVELRPIALEDLLGRPAAELDQHAIDKLIIGRRVLITGAGGSIGSELVRQIASRQPSELTLVDQGEFNLYQIDHEVGTRFPTIPHQALICDVRDRDRIHSIFITRRPELVFHAAALKHVPLVELNPCEGILTNAIGTRNVADAAYENGVRTFVQVSTDKAVNPTNIMGASKRLAEFYCQALDLAARDDQIGARPRFMTVRFGNVLGSSGSVAPLFQKQLEAGGPLTVTHPEIKRYFMTIPEAVSLILHASAHGAHADDSERGRILVLDMGKPIKIADLARQMIRIAGLEPERDIEIVYSGLRPGEKLYEELFDDAEVRSPAAIDGVLIASSRPIDRSRLTHTLEQMALMCAAGDEDGLRKYIETSIPGYQQFEHAA